MAGSYPDAPSRRMAWDVDGTHFQGYAPSEAGTGGAVGTPPASWTEATAQDYTDGNDENAATTAFHATTSSADNHSKFNLIFPEVRELDGFFFNWTGQTNGWSDYSLDTTNGYDGNWTNMNYAGIADTDLPAYRDHITSFAVASVKSIRGNIGCTSTSCVTNFTRLHVYGPISPGETPDRLVFLDTDAADAIFTKVLDWGDIPRGQTQVRQFKVKNNSASKTINTCQVTAEATYLNAATWYTFGDDDITYAATFAFGNLGPGASKGLWMKQIVPDGETLGVQAGRIKASHASLT